MARITQTVRRRQARGKADAPQAYLKKSVSKVKGLRQAAERLIDDFLLRVGYSNPAEQTDENGWRWFEHRSVRGRAGIVDFDTDGEVYLRVESLVGELPSDTVQALRYARELLEMNLTIPGAARLGIGGEGIFVCATIPITGLTGDAVHALIHSVMAISASFVELSAERVKQEKASQKEIMAVQVPDPSP